MRRAVGHVLSIRMRVIRRDEGVVAGSWASARTSAADLTARPGQAPGHSATRRRPGSVRRASISRSWSGCPFINIRVPTTLRARRTPVLEGAPHSPWCIQRTTSTSGGGT
jgi:hypothetical protein